MVIRRHIALSGVALLGMLSLVGCGPSNWERSFESTGAPATPLTPQDAVRIREVPWGRLDGALRELEAERAASDAPPDEWPDDKKAAAHARLLRALQVTAPPDSVEVLGRSVFRTTSSTSPHDDELQEFARRTGADLVVWSATYLGKTTVVRDEPVSEWRTGSYGDGRRGSRTFSENSTIWVPVVVEADENAYMAYFLREIHAKPKEIRLPDAPAKDADK